MAKWIIEFEETENARSYSEHQIRDLVEAIGKGSGNHDHARLLKYLRVYPLGEQPSDSEKPAGE